MSEWVLHFPAPPDPTLTLWDEDASRCADVSPIWLDSISRVILVPSEDMIFLKGVVSYVPKDDPEGQVVKVNALGQSIPPTSLIADIPQRESGSSMR